MLSLLAELSKKLDRNITFQFTVSFVAMVLIFHPEMYDSSTKLKFLFGIELPASLVNFVLPAILLKLFMDWAYDTYQYLLTRHRLDEELDRLYQSNGETVPKDLKDIILPPSAFKYIYVTDPQEEAERNPFAHLGYALFIVFIISVNVLLVTYYIFAHIPKDYYANIISLILVIVVYVTFYVLNYQKLNEILKINWYRRYFTLCAIMPIILTVAGFCLFIFSNPSQIMSVISK